MKRIVLINIICLITFLVKAQDTVNVSLPLDGKFYIYQDSYKNGSVTTDTNANIYKFSNGTLNNKVYINTDVTRKTVIFDSITTVTSTSYATFGKGSDGTFVFLNNCIWNFKFKIYQGEYLFSGDSLKFETSYGILLGLGGADCNLTLDLKYLNLNNATIEPEVSTYANKISVIINKGVINDGAIVTNAVDTGNIIIGSASINSELTGNIIDNDSNAVYQVKLPHNGSKSFTVQKEDGSGTYSNYRDYSFVCFHKDDNGDDDPCYYIYLPDGSYKATTGSADPYEFTVDGVAVNAAIRPVKQGDGIIDLSEGEFSLTDTGYVVGDQPYLYDGVNGYTFTGTTTNPLVIPDSLSSDTITFSNLTIERYGAVTNESPITIDKIGDFEIILNGYSYLTAPSSSECNGGIHKSGDGMLTISGTAADNSDTLSFHRYAYFSGTKLTVKSGTCTGVCIFSGDTLFVDGGVVSTNYLNTGGVTIINGGKLNRFDEMEHASGGELSPVTINGGTVYLEFKNSLDNGITETTKINGGSVRIENNCTGLAAAGDGTRPFASDGCPTTSSDATTTIYQSIYKLPVPAGTRIDSITVDDEAYLSNDVFTDTLGCIYLWLPETEDVGNDPVTNVTVYIDGIAFKYRGYVDCQYEYVAYTDAVNPGQGNKQEMIPVFQSVAENGSYLLSSDYFATYNDTLYACSGSDVSVSTTPDDYYELDSIAVNGEKLTDTIFTVVRPDQDITQMEVSVAFKTSATAINSIEASNIIVYGVQNAINIQGAENTSVQVINLSGVKVYEAKNVSSGYISIKPGMYIVVVNNKAHKVMVQ